jgi:hypothetical protein
MPAYEFLVFTNPRRGLDGSPPFESHSTARRCPLALANMAALPALCGEKYNTTSNRSRNAQFASVGPLPSLAVLRSQTCWPELAHIRFELTIGDRSTCLSSQHDGVRTLVCAVLIGSESHYR